jgi:hypothetical protein
MAPPMAGPTLRATLKPMLFSATAPARAERGSMSPTEACHAGALNAAPQPSRNVNSSNSHGLRMPAHAHTASATDTSSMNPCAASMTRRRSRLSAIAPATSDSSMTGNATEACTSATMSGDAAIESINQDAPTDWISPPRFDTVLASHSARNTGWRSGASGGAEGLASGIVNRFAESARR